MKKLEVPPGYPFPVFRLPVLAISLILISACATNRTQMSERQELSPQAAEKRIELDSRLEGTSISVEYENGTATLIGQVENLGQRVIAEEDLYELRGVHTVINNLTVKPPQIPDEEIMHSILEAIPSHCLAETEDIEVAVQQGNVTLAGRSKRLHHKDVITNIATFTRGVRSVDNQIQIVPELDGTKVTDLHMKKNIEGLLSSLPIRVEFLNIEVQDGVVTLSGTVYGSDDYRNLKRAVRNVPGVVRVKNKTRVLSGLHTPLY